MRVIKVGSADPIPLGYRGERDVTQVVFDLTDFIKTFGEGVAQLTVRRSGDPKEYAAAIEQNGNTAAWTVGAEWTAVDGSGSCQLSWYVGDRLAKSVTYKTRVQASMGESNETAPEPQAGYLAQVQAAGAQAVAADKHVTQVAATVTETARRFDAVVEETMEGMEETARRFDAVAEETMDNMEETSQAMEQAKAETVQAAETVKEYVENLPPDIAEMERKLNRRAQGMISEVTILSPGWKRVAVLTRGSSGFASISLGVNGPFARTAQMLMVGYSGYVSLPGFDETEKNRVCDPAGHPRLWQMVSHVRGENPNTTEPERIFRIDKVRLCYPKNRSEVDEASVDEKAWDGYYTPIHIYLDVHVSCDPSFDWSTIKPPPWGQLTLSTSITGLVNSDRIQPIDVETTVEDENPTGFNGVVCETYEMELENDTQLHVPGHSRIEELSVDKLYSRKQVQYDLNSGEVIPGRNGSVRLLDLEVTQQGVPFYVQPVCENMLVDCLMKDKNSTYKMSITRHANGIYEAHCGAEDGLTGSATYISILEQFPVDKSLAPLAPIVLKAGVRYVANDVWLQLISYGDYEGIRDSTNKMPANKEMTSIHGTGADRYSHGPTVIEAVDYDRVVARASIYFKKNGSYEGRCFYPQLCREGVEVIDPPLTSDNPVHLVTRPVPYTPKPTLMENSNDKQYARIRGVAYANELRVFSEAHPSLTGTATLETSVDFVEAVAEAVLRRVQMNP